MGNKLQDSHHNVGNSFDCVIYYCSVGNEVSGHGGILGVADGMHHLGGWALRWDSLVGYDLGSSSVYHQVAFCNRLPDLVIDNPYVDVGDAQGCRVARYGRARVPAANCSDPFDLPP